MEEQTAAARNPNPNPPAQRQRIHDVLGAAQVTAAQPTRPVADMPRFTGRVALQPGAPQARTSRAMASELATDAPLTADEDRPTRAGWRRTVYRATGGRINPGRSQDEIAEHALLAKLNTPISGARSVVVCSRKGGIGKTSTVLGVGSTCAEERKHAVAAIDANPDAGTLGERVPNASRNNIWHLRAALTNGELTPTGMQDFVNPNQHRLAVIRSDDDDSNLDAGEFGGDDYRAVMGTLQAYYPIVFTDTGTSVKSTVMDSALTLADQLVVVASAAYDEAKIAARTLDWLTNRGGRCAELSRNAIVVMSGKRNDTISSEGIESHFRKRCRHVFTIPWDPHIDAGGIFDLDQLSPQTRRRYLEISAVLIGELANTKGRN